MKLFIGTCLVVLFSIQGFAQTMLCDVQQLKDGVSHVNQIVVPISGNAHGDIVQITTDQFPNLSGFVSYVRGIAVIHINADNGMGFSTHTDISTVGQQAYYQLILPSTGTAIDAVVITCELDGTEGK